MFRNFFIDHKMVGCYLGFVVDKVEVDVDIGLVLWVLLWNLVYSCYSCYSCYCYYYSCYSCY